MGARAAAEVELLFYKRHAATRSVPVLLAQLEPGAVARAHDLDRSIRGLNPAVTGGDGQRLPKRMRVPIGSRARLEGDVAALGPVKCSAGATLDGCEPVFVTFIEGSFPDEARQPRG